MKVAIFGDSIAAGLGARGRQFSMLVAEALGAQLIDLSRSAAKVTYSVNVADQARDADLVLIYHGITEALIRPTQRSLRYFPARYRQIGWLDPRPYFSSRSSRRLAQKLESGLRWRVKNLLMRVCGSERMMEPPEYEASLKIMFGLLSSSKIIVLVGAAVEPRFFPGSNESLAHYADRSRKLCQAEGRTCVEVGDVCERWADYLPDRFHPNEAGHWRIADRILSSLSS